MRASQKLGTTVKQPPINFDAPEVRRAGWRQPPDVRKPWRIRGLTPPGSPAVVGRVKISESRRVEVWHKVTRRVSEGTNGKALAYASGYFVPHLTGRSIDETLWIDSDIGFEPDSVEQLRSHRLPIVCGI